MIGRERAENSTDSAIGRRSATGGDGVRVGEGECDFTIDDNMMITLTITWLFNMVVYIHGYTHLEVCEGKIVKRGDSNCPELPF